MTDISITTEYIPLDSFLKLCGAVMSGGEAKELVREGGVLVNGAPCEQRKKKLRAGDEVTAFNKTYKVVGA